MDDDVRYVATINVPGYVPMDDEPPVFDTPAEAWGYLADVRQREEDDDETETEYTDTLAILRYIASGEHQHGSPHEDWPTNADGTGVVYGGTPGYDGDHDLGLAYSVGTLRKRRLPAMATEYAAFPDHPLHDVPDEILRAARDMVHGAVGWGNVDTETADPLADAVVIALKPWLKY